MTPDDGLFGDSDDELNLLRHEAAALGMPGQITPASVGITLRPPGEMLTQQSRPRSGKKIAVRIVAVAASLAGVLAVTFVPWQQDQAAAGPPAVLEYQFADVRNIADAPGKDARAVLMKLSRTAAAQPEKAAAGSTQFVLTENWFSEQDNKSAAKLVPSRREQWFREDGSIRIRESRGEPLNLDGRGLSISAKPRLANVVNETYPADETFAPRFVDRLSADYRRARDTLLDATNCPARVPGATRLSCLHRKISGTASNYVIPPDVSAAFWRILADEPSMRSLGAVKDRAGRSGVGISFIPAHAPMFRLVLIISPRTGELLGTEEILIKDSPDIGFTAPAIMSFTAILQSRYTDAVGPTD